MRLGHKATHGDAHAQLDTGYTVAEVEAGTLRDARGDAHTLVGTLADTVAADDAVTLADAGSDVHALATLCLTRYQRWKQ